jgi:hypothetical protein
VRISLISKPGHLDTGVGKYVVQLERTLVSLGHHVIVVVPFVPIPEFLIQWLKRWPGIDIEAFLYNYPLWARYPKADIYHFTSQNLATLLIFCPPPGKCIVTVHDLIPWLVKDDHKLRIYRHTIEKFFDRLAIMGMKKANGWIADSEFTGQTLIKIGVSAVKINLGV